MMPVTFRQDRAIRVGGWVFFAVFIGFFAFLLFGPGEWDLARLGLLVVNLLVALDSARETNQLVRISNGEIRIRNKWRMCQVPVVDALRFDSQVKNRRPDPRLVLRDGRSIRAQALDPA